MGFKDDAITIYKKHNMGEKLVKEYNKIKDRPEFDPEKFLSLFMITDGSITDYDGSTYGNNYDLIRGALEIIIEKELDNLMAGNNLMVGYPPEEEGPISLVQSIGGDDAVGDRGDEDDELDIIDVSAPAPPKLSPKLSPKRKLSPWHKSRSGDDVGREWPDDPDESAPEFDKTPESNIDNDFMDDEEATARRLGYGAGGEEFEGDNEESEEVEGYKAYQEGEEVEENPYPMDSKQYENWLNGFKRGMGETHDDEDYDVLGLESINEKDIALVITEDPNEAKKLINEWRNKR